MMEKLVKYVLITVDEQDIELVGVYVNQEEAKKAMRDAFMEMIDVAPEETDDAGIDEYSARILDSVSKDGHNHDWKIEKISVMGDCRKAEEGDDDIVIGTFEITAFSEDDNETGETFKTPCKVNMKTKKVFDFGPIGRSDEEWDTENTVTLSGEDYPYIVVDVSKIMEENIPKMSKEKLLKAQETGMYWASEEYATLEEAIAYCDRKEKEEK